MKQNPNILAVKSDATPFTNTATTTEHVFSTRLKKPILIERAEAGQVGFFLQFGGQAASYIDELRGLYTQFPLVRPLIEDAHLVLAEEMRHPDAIASGVFQFGMDLQKWLTLPEMTPPAAYLVSAPVSQSLIFVTQIANYVVATEYGCSPQTLLAATKGATGHSQGVMAAVLAAQALTGDDFKKMFLRMVRYFFWQGLRMQQSFFEADVPAELVAECAAAGWGVPSPMAAVTGLTPEELALFLQRINTTLPTERQVYLSLINGWRRLVVSGSPEGIVFLRRALAQKEKAEKNNPMFTTQIRFEFLAVQAPYHCPHMQAGLARFREDIRRLDLKLSAQNLTIPVYATDDGRDLRASPDLLEDLMQLQFFDEVNWPKCTQTAGRDHGVTHVIDFGPGEMASTLTFVNREGSGVVVIPFAAKKGRDEFFTTDATALRFNDTIWSEFAPQLVRVADGVKTQDQLALDNRYVRFTGRPPIFGGGMTPTTVESDIVVAAANQGYLVEWAGGGQPTEAILRRRMDEIVQALQPGQGIIFNALYLDAYLWNLHYPLLGKLKAEGYPIDGVTISAGVPTRETAQEILRSFQAQGIWCNAFKPGSDAQIQSVLEIADDHPDMMLQIQIEGGRAGGHHSWEDVYGLVERNYAAIRRRKNLILCVGGGVSSEAEAWEFLQGTWHKSGRVMPVDAVFLGTRLMACQEAKTSPQVKKLLTTISGTDSFVKRGEFVAGVTSGQSQLGADVHYADNAMARVAHFIDQMSQQDENVILANKDKIVAELARTAKPYFGDVATMTYAAVLERLLTLLAPGKMPSHFVHDEPFFDTSYRLRVFEWARRMVARLIPPPFDELSAPPLIRGAGGISLDDPVILNNPQKFSKELLRAIPLVTTAKLHPEDVDYFLYLCRLPGKPVNFVPVIDKDIKRWFKSDSLWQAHDPRYTAEQVLTIPGVTAVRGIQKVDEPVATVLESFVNYGVKQLLRGAQAMPALRVDYLGQARSSVRAISTGEIQKTVTDDGAKITLRLKCDVSEILWRHEIAAQGFGAIAALVTATRVVEGQEVRENRVAHLLRPEAGAFVVLCRDKETITQMTYCDSQGRPVCEFSTASVKGQTTVTVRVAHVMPSGKKTALVLNYLYQPTKSLAPLSLDLDEALAAITKFYSELWLGDGAPAKTKGSIWQSFEGAVTITRDPVLDFAAATWDRSPSLLDGVVPLSYAIVLLWKPLSQCLFQKDLHVDLLNLLHLSNEFKVESHELLKVGDAVKTSVQLTARENDKQGQTLTIVGKIERDGQLMITLTTRFRIRRASLAILPAHEVRIQESVNITITDLIEKRLVEQKWVQFKSPLRVGMSCLFVVSGFERRERDGRFDFEMTGHVTHDGKKIGVIDCHEHGSSLLQNPVLYFFKRHAHQGVSDVPHRGGFSFSHDVISPEHNQAYARASQDINPIHNDEKFAVLAGLPANAQGRTPTIAHGMWSSGVALALLQRSLQRRVLGWKADFLGMVPPATALLVQGTHVANHNGASLYDVRVTNPEGQTVMSARATVAPKRTAYIFTGQGSQTVGMGMQAYQNSAAARAVWDQAEAYCQQGLGFSLLQVVRDNPKDIFVRGEKVSHPKGVLNLTQFAQVALTVLAMSQTAELQAAGVYAADAVFAGHSLGEYAALSCAGILPLEKVIRVVYERGLTMQNFVPRNAKGESPYGMIVVRPKLVGWSEKDLEQAVTQIAGKTGELYVVNYNLNAMQYAITGRLELLNQLTDELTKIETARGLKRPTWAMIAGVDVPFHSSVLRPGVEAFRKTLEETIPQQVDPQLLVNRYIPNLNAELFRLDFDYVKSVAALSGSPILQTIITQWKSVESDLAKLARVLLIELLAYQFASPVQWIRTQNVILKDTTAGVRRVLEIGPSAVLANMLRTTIAQESVAVAPEVIHFDSERDAALYHTASVESSVSVAGDQRAASSVTGIVLQPALVIPAVGSTHGATPTNANLSLSAPQDRPFTPAVGLKTLLGLKLNLRLDEIRDADTIEALSGGNSARRNEILSEMGAEFQIGAIDDAHQMPIEKLVSVLGDKTSYQAPGAILTKAIERALKEKLALSRMELVEHLQNERMLPDGLVQRALSFVPLAVRTAVSARGGALSTVGIPERLHDKTAALDWLNKMTDAFAVLVGITIPYRSQMQGGSAGAVVSEEALKSFEEKFFGKKSPFANWARDLSELCGLNEKTAITPDVSEELERLRLYKEAFGPNVEKVVAPLFDARKKVSFTSSWNWVRRELIQNFWRCLASSSLLSADETARLVSAATPETIATMSYLSQLAATKGEPRLARQLKTLAGDALKHSQKQAVAMPAFVPTGGSFAPSVHIDDAGQIQYHEQERPKLTTPTAVVDELISRQHVMADDIFLAELKKAARQGLSFVGKTAIVTGASPGAIAWEVLAILLAGGARVIATTSRYQEERVRDYRKLYQKHAAVGAELHLFPFSQGSRHDIEALVSWCFEQKWLPDYLLPFGAVGETATLTMMDADTSTATLRVLLQGVEWLIAAIAKRMRAAHVAGRTCLAVLPLSPNHGVFGGDGAYADAKLGLEALLERWHSEHEDWGRFVAVAGAKIGWVRGTGLMAANNIVAATMEEEAGVRTFATKEAGLILATLCQDSIVAAAQKAPLHMAFTGGFERVKNLGTLATTSRKKWEVSAKLKRDLSKEREDEQQHLLGVPALATPLLPKAGVLSEFPKLIPLEDRSPSPAGKKYNPDDVVVVVGYGEVSPFGSSRPRFELECGSVSMAGAIELAWIMGLIRYENGLGKTKHVGWVDAKTGALLTDGEIWKQYSAFITANTGVRFADAEVQNFDAAAILVFTDVVLESPLTFTTENAAVAEQYLKHYAGRAATDMTPDGHTQITLPVGSVIKVPRRVASSRRVAGQIPKGWDSTRFGVPADLAAHIDRTTQFNMVASAAAFVSAGLEPEELWTAFAPTRIGNAQGGGMGGMTALTRMYHDHREDRERQGDTLQETLINVGPAWINQSFVGGYGPTVNPVAACATAIVSLGVGVDLIQQGKADFVLTGGYDDYSEEGVVGFADMAATCNTDDMLAQGISPKHMSRPNDTRRGGFVEAQGGGTLLVTRLSQALKMGLPIYAVLAFATNFSDGVHTSIPAPGLGLLGMAQGGQKSPLGQALAKFGLTADDITVVSKHDTSTAANDPNENKIHHLTQQILGRSPGNPLLVHSQKAMLGHAKGGAGAWQAIAALQMLNTGKVPGNPNLDDVDPAMRAFSTLSFSDETIDLGVRGVRGVLMTSLGFGHVGAVCLMIHPDFVLDRTTQSDYKHYVVKRTEREETHQSRYWHVLMGKTPLFVKRDDKLSADEQVKLLLG